MYVSADGDEEGMAGVDGAFVALEKLVRFAMCTKRGQMLTM